MISANQLNAAGARPVDDGALDIHRLAGQGGALDRLVDAARKDVLPAKAKAAREGTAAGEVRTDAVITAAGAGADSRRAGEGAVGHRDRRVERVHPIGEGGPDGASRDGEAVTTAANRRGRPIGDLHAGSGVEDFGVVDGAIAARADQVDATPFAGRQG